MKIHREDSANNARIYTLYKCSNNFPGAPIVHILYALYILHVLHFLNVLYLSSTKEDKFKLSSPKKEDKTEICPPQKRRTKLICPPQGRTSPPLEKVRIVHYDQSLGLDNFGKSQTIHKPKILGIRYS